MSAILDFSKRLSGVWRAMEPKFKILAIYPQKYYWDIFDTKLSMFCLVFSTTEEGAKAEQGLEGPPSSPQELEGLAPSTQIL